MNTGFKQAYYETPNEWNQHLQQQASSERVSRPPTVLSIIGRIFVAVGLQALLPQTQMAEQPPRQIKSS